MMIQLLETLVGQNLNKVEEYANEDREIATGLQGEVSGARKAMEESREFEERIISNRFQPSKLEETEMRVAI